MASILDFVRRKPAPAARPAAVAAFVEDFSIEVMPKTAAKIADFRGILPEGTRICLAHIDGTPMEEMLATARRLIHVGFAVIPHFAARGIATRDELAGRIAAYSDVGVRQALVLAGGIDTPHGGFHEAMQLLETGLFDQAGFTHLH
ncbi:MAG TPA: methylenetetrahydrofolate reductase, partial [Amaricoccus sp.]|nr:methylenetetrahydrofolate reductase [Amaricoccus sp.]